MQTPPKPFAFDGTVEALYRAWIEPILPTPKLVERFQRWLSKYCAEDSPVFPIRQVRGAKRRRVYETSDGTRFAPADNSPAWAVHTYLMQGRLSSYAQFRQSMLEMPAHIFDLPRTVGPTANSWGYYFAHLFPVKNGDINFRAWPRSEVERRCYLTLHPCNFFAVPGGRSLGERKSVIRFVAAMYRKRYRATWLAFLKRVGESDSSLGMANPADWIRSPRRAELAPTQYKYGRLCFKRDIIEPLTWEQCFEVITPMGTYRFSKRQFYDAFPKIVRTLSYRERGIYHGAKLHQRAGSFRVP